MVRLTKIYTRTGDNGETSLGDGTRVSKEELRVETYGTIDEVNTIIGLVRTQTKDSELIILDNILAAVQNELFDLGAEISIPLTKNNIDIIEKTRYHVIVEGKQWDVDQFHGNNDGLWIAEVELKSEDEQVTLPKWVTNEVTGEFVPGEIGRASCRERV